MPAHFLDSSALVKGYRLEAGSEQVHELLRGSDPLIVAQISHLEVSSAMVRRARETALSDQELQIALDELDREIADSFEVIRADDLVIASAIRLTRIHRLRAADALQLSSALTARQSWPEFNFVCSDLELNRSALAEGLAVLNPAS